MVKYPLNVSPFALTSILKFESHLQRTTTSNTLGRRPCCDQPTHSRVTCWTITSVQFTFVVKSKNFTGFGDDLVAKQRFRGLAHTSVSRSTCDDQLSWRGRMRAGYAKTTMSAGNTDASLNKTRLSSKDVTSTPCLTLTLPSIINFAQPTSRPARKIR